MPDLAVFRRMRRPAVDCLLIYMQAFRCSARPELTRLCRTPLEDGFDAPASGPDPESIRTVATAGRRAPGSCCTCCRVTKGDRTPVSPARRSGPAGTTTRRDAVAPIHRVSFRLSSTHGLRCAAGPRSNGGVRQSPAVTSAKSARRRRGAAPAGARRVLRRSPSRGRDNL